MNSSKLKKNINFYIINDSKMWSRRIQNIKKIISSVLKNPKYFINSKIENYNISFLLTNNKTIKRLNTIYRNEKKSTNVLTFTSLKKISKNKDIRYSDIAISGNIIKKEANKLKISFYDHFTHIIIHSLLHTNNYRHNSKKNFQKMKKIEILLLKKLNINNPYK